MSHGQQEAAGKTASVFCPPAAIQSAKDNARRYPWAAEIAEELVRRARPWVDLADEELWGLMFGNTIRRSWMVWSSGHCPSCGEGVPMYNWEIDAIGVPWKVRCPHCRELFPKNDFGRFYESGLDAGGVFDPTLADRSLLYNTEHPDPADPLHGFGVDDGEGYVEGDKRWRFVGAYLIYGQWKQAVLGGICSLSAAYAVTGEEVYAHKAGVLLDRVADLYPSFDFKTQGVMYEGPAHAGYVSTWHDACEEVRQLALAYDQVFPVLSRDTELAAFATAQAERHGIGASKATPAAVCRHIEQGILWDTLHNAGKITSNYPRREIALAIIRTVLGWPQNRDEVLGAIDALVQQATAVDGVTGEKGLAGYSAGVIQSLAGFLEQYATIDPEFLPALLQRRPNLAKTYRFHIDTWCLEHYYPLSGDTGSFALRFDDYVGVDLPGAGNPMGKASWECPLSPSGYSFLWRLCELTGDVAYAQVVYRANGGKVDGLPRDIFARDPERMQRELGELIRAEGERIQVGSVNKQQWHLAILRSGRGDDERCAWLDYDSGGGHGHADGMNLGLFSRGLDLMPDFGYPPVHYDGWEGTRFNWYVHTVSHNTVVVDGKSQPAGAGETTLWADGEAFGLIRASAPALIGGAQYERTIAMVDIDEQDSYLLDIFRVIGGSDHAKFQHSHFSTLQTRGLSLSTGEDYGHGAVMRDYQTDASAAPGWQADFSAIDELGYLPQGATVGLRYIDLTAEAAVSTAEAWVSPRGFSGYSEAWIPRLVIRRRGEAPLASSFVSVAAPYGAVPGLREARRLPLTTGDGREFPQANVCVEVALANGTRDVLVSADTENPRGLEPSWPQEALCQAENALRLEGDTCLVRYSADGELQVVALCRAKSLSIGDIAIRVEPEEDYVEVHFVDGTPRVVVGRAESVHVSG